MQAKFHLYVRRFRDGRYAIRVLTHPRFAVYGEKLKTCRDELHDVLARVLALEELKTNETEHWPGLSTEVMALELRAVQHERLIRVPMRFLVAHHEQEDGSTSVHVPTLDLRFAVHGTDERALWTEERIRGALHLATVSKLVSHRFAKHERIETLVVTYHGAGRYKDALRAKALKKATARANEAGVGGPLQSAGIEWVEEARRGRLSRALGRNAEVARVVGMLTERSGRAVVLRGPSGVGKTAVVAELAHRMANKREPALEGLPLWEVSGNRILSGLPFLGQWQERMLSICRAMRSNGGILYGGDLLELAMAGIDEEGASAATLLEPFVRDDAIRVVVEASDESWTRAERLAPALCRMLRRVDVRGMDSDTAMGVLTTLGTRMGRAQNTLVDDVALRRAFELLARFGGAESLPGSGIQLLDRMIRLAPGRTLTASDAVRAFSRTTGFPEVLVDPDQALDEQALRDVFGNRVVGQPAAVDALTELILVVKAGLASPGRPLGSFLLVGPTGVGKTESAKALATWLFGDANRLLRFDMSEYADPGAAWRLLDGATSLTARVRERPFSVVLLDEIEKADPSVFDVLLQVLDEGRLSDGSGRLTGFQHTIVLMTSNLGARESRPIGPQEAPSLVARYRTAAEAFFRPEFVNRVGRIVPFGPLGTEELATIAETMLSEALQREGLSRRGVSVSWGPEVLGLLVEQGTDPEYGARPLKRAIDRLVVQPLSRALVAGELEGHVVLRREGERVRYEAP